MPQGLALLVGIKDASSGGSGCEESVEMMERLIAEAGKGKYHIEIMTTQTAQKPTPEAILSYIDHATTTLQHGDIFVFFFAGHGDQVKDNSGDEKNGQDDVLCALGGNIVDDELAIRWKKFRPGVRIVMLSDSCHSGTNYYFVPSNINLNEVRFGNNTKNEKQVKSARPISFANTQLAADGMQAQLIHFGACSDDQLANADPAGGDFTIALTMIWKEKKGNFLGYEKFFEEVKRELPRILKIRHGNEIQLQSPQYSEFGPVDTAFRNSKPFALE